MSEFMFLRPWWLLALLPLLFVARRLLHKKREHKAWQGVVDDALAPYVLHSETVRQRHRVAPWFLLLGLLMIIALSGPVWERKEIPVFRAGDKLVIVLDLSQSMNATDVRPSRLQRAKHKVSDMLKWLPDAQIGLIVFSEVPYVISPITDDADTISAFLPALSTDVVPVQGSKISLALDKAGDLLKRTNASRGQVVLITDSAIDPGVFTAAKGLQDNGYSLSVLGVGTEKGGPITLADGNLLRDSSGKVVLARLDASGLRDLVASVDGVYSDLQSDDTDLRRLIRQQAGTVQQDLTDGEVMDKFSEQWVEYAPWLLPLITVLSAIVFRRGVL